MFKYKEVKENIKGVLELFLFMSRGLDRFKDDKTSAIKSFIVPLFLMPTFLILAYYEGGHTSIVSLLILHISQIIVATAIFLSAIYFFAKHYKRMEHFYKFITVTNWMSFAVILFMIPVTYGLLSGIMTWEQVEPFCSVIVLIFCAINAFIITYLFKIPFELGVFLAIFNLMVGQETLSLTYLIKDIIV